MKIDKLSDREKGVLLARAMGRLVYDTNEIPGLETWREWKDGAMWHDFSMPNFYNPRNMALAWRVLNWAATKEWGLDLDTWLGNKYWLLMNPDSAQRLWLDHILRLAIEAGIVEVPG